MDNFPENLKIEEVENLIISEIENRTKLKLKQGDFNLKLELNQDRIIGKVYIFGEYYDNFWVLLPNEEILEKVCECTFLTLENYGELKGLLISGKRNSLENELKETTKKILDIIQSTIAVKEYLGDITIMVDEKYPYEEFYENHFPIWQYKISDTTKKINIIEKLDFELSNFDEEQILNQVVKELNKILKKNKYWT